MDFRQQQKKKKRFPKSEPGTSGSGLSNTNKQSSRGAWVEQQQQQQSVFERMPASWSYMLDSNLADRTGRSYIHRKRRTHHHLYIFVKEINAPSFCCCFFFNNMEKRKSSRGEQLCRALTELPDILLAVSHHFQKVIYRTRSVVGLNLVAWNKTTNWNKATCR